MHRLYSIMYLKYTLGSLRQKFLTHDLSCPDISVHMNWETRVMVSAFHLQPDVPWVLTPAEPLKALEDINTSPLPVTSEQGSMLACYF